MKGAYVGEVRERGDEMAGFESALHRFRLLLSNSNFHSRLLLPLTG